MRIPPADEGARSDWLSYLPQRRAGRMEIDMKNFWAKIKIAICVCAAFGWWGVLYPELVLTADTCKICSEQEKQGYFEGQDIYWKLLEADRGEIRFRSRLLTEWNKFMEAMNESDQYGVTP